MKRAVFAIVLLAPLTLSPVAGAAAVEIFARQTSATTWDVLAQTSVDITGIALMTTGFTSSVLNTVGVPSIEAEVSPFRQENGGVQINSFWHVNLLSAGAPETLLLTMVGTGGPTTILPGDRSFGYTVVNGGEIERDYSLTLVFSDGTTLRILPEPPVPEPPAVPPVNPPPQPPAAPPVNPTPLPPTTGPVIPTPEPAPIPPILEPPSTGSVTPIPEPHSVLLFAAGSIAVAFAIARNRRDGRSRALTEEP